MYSIDFGATTFSTLGDPRATRTPFDYGQKQGNSVTAGFTKTLWDGAELIVDGGVRNKKQQAGFFGDPASIGGLQYSYVDFDAADLVDHAAPEHEKHVWQRVIEYPHRHRLLQLAVRLEPKPAIFRSAKSHLQSLAANRGGILATNTGPLAEHGFLIRCPHQQLHLTARDRYDPTAPFGTLAAQASPLDKDETNHALHIGLEHRLNEYFTLFGRAARAFRTPNVDERVVTGPAYEPAPSFAAIPQNFQLNTQTSYDVEGGVRIHGGPLDIQTSIYDMHLKNEIHYNPVQIFNYNLDPTHRYGSETSASLRVNEAFRLRGGFTYTRAVFEEGPFTGKDVPLVSRLSGSAGFTWNVWQKYVVLDASARFWSSRRLDNDQLNRQPVIPANATLDLKLSGEIDRFFWSAAVINVFNTEYYVYGIASATTAGSYAIYPLPGRTFMVKAGMTF